MIHYGLDPGSFCFFRMNYGSTLCSIIDCCRIVSLGCIAIDYTSKTVKYYVKGSASNEMYDVNPNALHDN